MEKIINVSALIDQLRILGWSRNLTREEAIERAIKAVEEAGEELIRCKDCFFEDRECRKKFTTRCGLTGKVRGMDGFCHDGVRRDSDD